MPSDNAVPPCHNRPPVSDVVRTRDGLTDDGRAKFVVIPHLSPDRCTQWDGKGIGPNGESFAEHHYGRRCEGCRWLPEGVL